MRPQIVFIFLVLLTITSAFSNTYIGCLRKKVVGGFSYGFVLTDNGDGMTIKIYSSFDNDCFYSPVAIQSSGIIRAYITTSTYLEEFRTIQSTHPEFTRIMNREGHCGYKYWRTFEKLDQFGRSCNGSSVFIKNSAWDYEWENYGVVGVLTLSKSDSIILDLQLLKDSHER